MSFTDIFVKRPVLATVVSLLILLVGFRSMAILEVRQYPHTMRAVVHVTTAYPGADSELVQSFITAPLQRVISEAEGIDYMTSTSRQGVSEIQAYMKLNYDPNAAIAEIQAKVASQRNILPESSEDPVIDMRNDQGFALMYLAFYSETMSPEQITDYLMRSVVPRLQAIPGVAKAQINGDQSFAMRLWLDPKRMAALGVAATDVRETLINNNFQAGVGQTKDDLVTINLSATTDIYTVEAFENLVIRSDGNTLVRMRDVADVELGSRNYDITAWYNGKMAVMMAVEAAPGANPLEVADEVQSIMPDVERQLPEALNLAIPHDGSDYIEKSIAEVFQTLAEAVFIVLLVVYLSLGSWHAAIVPAVSVPLSLIGAAFIMLVLGFSINMLTLLAMLLAIGLVVDDAIVVVENVHRHIAEGKSRFDAALIAARELTLPIISMTTTLLAVYAPIGFMGGLVGIIFTEFAFALAGAVLISGIVALTLSPMLSSKVLSKTGKSGRFEDMVEHFFNGLSNRYRRALGVTLNYQPVTYLFAAVIVGSIYFMFTTSTSELAPLEQRGVLNIQMSAPETATLEYSAAYGRQMIDIFESIPEYTRSFIMIGGGGTPATSFGGFRMTAADGGMREGDRPQEELHRYLQSRVNEIAGVQIAVFNFPVLPGAARGAPIQFVITSDQDYQQLDGLADQMIGEAYQSGLFVFLNKSIDYSLPRTKVVIDRDRAGDLGIEMQDVGLTLATLLGGNNINRFSLSGRSYEVIPQVAREFRGDPSTLDNYYVRSASGELVPLSSIVSFEQSIEPTKRTQFQQLNSVTVNAIMTPGVPLGQAIEFIETKADELFPREFSYDYVGEARQFKNQGTALVLTFFLSILVIYLVLAAQFESWRDPLIILISVPMSIAGAMIFITLGFATVNIYTQVGLITLIGLIAKNGILIVDFANRQQTQHGKTKREAVEEAAAIRLRPILMTTIAMLMAMVPLLMATGPGAPSRFQIGLVIVTGLGIGTIFTLFVVPSFYMLLAKDRRLVKPRGSAQTPAGETQPAE
ncbi:MAG: efflux RND transporter permease subunit [Alphaproteobacteria bacterium]